MRRAVYRIGGTVAIEDGPEPGLPDGGIVVRVEACGLCSGELMDWYMDSKAPHTLGHEVAGIVEQSSAAEYPVGARAFVHHHAPCMGCGHCARGAYVHCPQWRRTRLDPGGMAERFAASGENLGDAFLVDDLRAVDAALIEPLACVAKAIRRGRVGVADRVAVVGLGSLGLMHLLVLESKTKVGYEISASRRDWACGLGLDALAPDRAVEADVAFVCPGREAAIEFAARIVRPDGVVVLFAPLPPGGRLPLAAAEGYFRDLTLVHSYSCGPDDTREAARWLRSGSVRAEQVVSHFVELSDLPQAYQAMKRGDILKAMVVF